MRHPILRLVLPILLCAVGAGSAADELRLTLRGPESASDHRLAYTIAAVRLALDKTLASHGPYRLQFAPPMNKQRALRSARQRDYPNFMIMSSPEDGRDTASLVPIRFPINLGAAGWRICFVSPAAQQAVARSQTLEDLRRFRHVQGLGWADAGILRANGFKVSEVGSYEALFGMVALGRVDLFCRSVLEVQAELQAHAGMAGLQLDRSFVLVYELPQFLYTHRDNRELVERLSLGLHKAYADGSLLRLFRQHMLPALRLAELPRRRIFRLLNPPRPAPDFDYRQYDLDLLAFVR